MRNLSPQQILPPPLLPGVTRLAERVSLVITLVQRGLMFRKSPIVVHALAQSGLIPFMPERVSTRESQAWPGLEADLAGSQHLERRRSDAAKHTGAGDDATGVETP